MVGMTIKTGILGCKKALLGITTESSILSILLRIYLACIVHDM